MDRLLKEEGFPSQKLIVLPDHILAEYAAHPLIRPLHITDIGCFPYARHHYRRRPEGSEAYIVMYCTDGCGWVKLDDERRHEVRKGELAVIPAGTPHEYGSSEEEPWTIYWIHLKGELASSFFGEHGKAAPVPIPVERSSTIIGLFDECYEMLLKGYTLDHVVYVSQLACHLAGIIRLVHAFRQAAPSPRRQLDIEKAIQYMTEHLEDNVSLAELAAEAALSVPHFTQLFKKKTGYSPIDYYLRLKIQLASQYLDLTDQSVKAVGVRVGFQDPYYFSRLFKKIMGKSPSAYRSTHKG
ncbi:MULTISPECIES: AraC family transcriptional regulator [unclassified Paenibacillus]|uniref:AraC family transcriptional regulator n=1 Tax=unclassified Paenibacillus TaxID=185978 RepID=UPI001049DF36|nr:MULTISPECIES: AraC family transcriptional regulator [unclassified Paenibacillus]NIK70374.1 AraC-like DNA-binding protein/mannose-6-phosphate isomerase-like protein (cupin superfamily) [Paenibacillus sp. BK720]TCM90702.1 AraC-like protein [Paenibacillus sp. BK033]